MNYKYPYKYLSSQINVVIYYYGLKRIKEIRYLKLRLFIVSFISKVELYLYNDESSFIKVQNFFLPNDDWSIDEEGD